MILHCTRPRPLTLRTCRLGTRTPALRGGVTLIELIVTLALLAILSSVVGLSLNRAAPARAVDARTARLAAARDEALRSGHAVSVTIVDGGRAYFATAFPDGRVLADPELGIEPLTGRVRQDAPSAVW